MWRISDNASISDLGRVRVVRNVTDFFLSPGVQLFVVKPVLPRLMIEIRSCSLIMRQLLDNGAGPFLNLNILPL